MVSRRKRSASARVSEGVKYPAPGPRYCADLRLVCFAFLPVADSLPSSLCGNSSLKEDHSPGRLRLGSDTSESRSYDKYGALGLPSFCSVVAPRWRGARRPESLVFRDARVFDAREVLPRATVLVWKGRITAVGPTPR